MALNKELERGADHNSNNKNTPIDQIETKKDNVDMDEANIDEETNSMNGKIKTKTPPPSLNIETSNVNNNNNLENGTTITNTKSH